MKSKTLKVWKNYLLFQSLELQKMHQNTHCHITPTAVDFAKLRKVETELTRHPLSVLRHRCRIGLGNRCCVACCPDFGAFRVSAWHPSQTAAFITNWEHQAFSWRKSLNKNKTGVLFLKVLFRFQFARAKNQKQCQVRRASHLFHRNSTNISAKTPNN